MSRVCSFSQSLVWSPSLSLGSFITHPSGVASLKAASFQGDLASSNDTFSYTWSKCAASGRRSGARRSARFVQFGIQVIHQLQSGKRGANSSQTWMAAPQPLRRRCARKELPPHIYQTEVRLMSSPSRWLFARWCVAIDVLIPPLSRSFISPSRPPLPHQRSERTRHPPPMRRQIPRRPRFST